MLGILLPISRGIIPILGMAGISMNKAVEAVQAGFCYCSSGSQPGNIHEHPQLGQWL
jgi:hypothetical protein